MLLADDVADLDGLESLQQQIPRGLEVLAPMRFRCGAVARRKNSIRRRYERITFS